MRVFSAASMLLLSAHMLLVAGTTMATEEEDHRGSSIPRIIHQIWIQGDAALPSHYGPWRDSWAKHHPGWRFKFWDGPAIRSVVEKTLPSFLGVYDTLPVISQADAGRYLLLQTEGGVYIDMDMECLQSLDQLPLNGADVFMGLEPEAHTHLWDSTADTALVSNALLGSTPQHPFWGHVLEQIRSDIHGDNASTVINGSGPGLLQRALANFDDRAARNEIVVLPAQTFNALGGDVLNPLVFGDEEAAREKELEVLANSLALGTWPAGAFALHHWAGAWVKQKSAPFGRFAEGSRLASAGRVEDALSMYKAAVLLSKGIAAIAAESGSGDHCERAISVCAEAVELDPSFAAAHKLRGEALTLCGRNEEAASAFQSALEWGMSENAQDASALYVSIGRSLHAGGGSENGERARTAFATALDLNPANARAHLSLGQALEDAGEYAEAANAFQAAIVAEPTFMLPYVSLGAILKLAGRTADAVTVYRAAIDQDPAESQVHLNLGSALKALGRVDDAREAFKRAVEIEPRDAVAHYNLGVVLEEGGDSSKAAAAYSEATRHNPDFREAHFNLGAIHWGAQEWRQAAVAFETAAVLGDEGSIDLAAECRRRM